LPLSSLPGIHSFVAVERNIDSFLVFSGESCISSFNLASDWRMRCLDCGEPLMLPPVFRLVLLPLERADDLNH